ncbi:MAG: TerB family tellurite resistance protein [Bacteroidota bacterium]
METPFEKYEEFLLFLLIHIANADHMFKLDEAIVILTKMEDMFDTENGVDKLLSIFMQMQDNYDKLSNDEISDVIKINLTKFDIKDDLADRLFNELYEVVNADGHIHENETKAIERIKKLVNPE